MVSSKIKIGDLVRVLQPHTFVRCGYPLSKADVKVELKETLAPELDAFLSAHKVYPDEHAMRQLIDTLSYTVMQHRGFGGDTRAIHTKEDPEIVGQTFRVVGKKRHVSGERYGGHPPSGRFDDDYDGCGPELEGQQQHTILSLERQASMRSTSIFYSEDSDVRIEQIHVTRVLSQDDIRKELKSAANCKLKADQLRLDHNAGELSILFGAMVKTSVLDEPSRYDFKIDHPNYEALQRYLKARDIDFNVVRAGTVEIENLQDFCDKLTGEGHLPKKKRLHRL